ncbi:hypothetical protein Fot_57780 [Forsythia ovata]|uniref:Uncharacterized protein n=1 Tax=Forsythia ovata TaxID=205694 RepID=A0ABD1NWZ2_9LAMI
MEPSATFRGFQRPETLALSSESSNDKQSKVADNYCPFLITLLKSKEKLWAIPITFIEVADNFFKSKQFLNNAESNPDFKSVKKVYLSKKFFPFKIECASRGSGRQKIGAYVNL